MDFFHGRRIDHMTRDQLVEALDETLHELKRTTTELLWMRPHVDWTGYLRSKGARDVRDHDDDDDEAGARADEEGRAG